MSSLSLLTSNERWVELPEQERNVESREKTIFESYTDVENKREAVRNKVRQLRELVAALADDVPARDELESGLIGLESVGDDLEQTFEPLVELRAEYLRRREALCKRVAEDVSRLCERLGRAGSRADELHARAQRAVERRAQETPETTVDATASELPSTPSIERDAVAEPSNDVVDLGARVTPESEDNFWAGLDAESGVFVSTINILPLGQRVHVRVDVEGMHSVNAYGVVRWFRDWDDDQPELHPGMGIELQELDESQKRVVEEFMSRRDPWLFV